MIQPLESWNMQVRSHCPVVSLTQNDGREEEVEEELGRELWEVTHSFFTSGIICNDPDNDSHDNEHA